MVEERTKKILRTCAFYAVFWPLVAAFFAVMLLLFLNTLDPSRPKWLLDDSLIGSNPGLSLRPKSRLIWYNVSNEGSEQEYQNSLESFLWDYYDLSQVENVQNCIDEYQPDVGKVCEFKIDDDGWAPCTRNFGYGYGGFQGGFCIFLKLNKIFNWVPEVYRVDNLPFSMPDDLKTYIRANNTLDYVHVDCQGANSADVKNIGAISYKPSRGFHKKYFPYRNTQGYLSPLVAVHFENPQKGVWITVVCRAWAQNIHHDYQHEHGAVKFFVRIES